MIVSRFLGSGSSAASLGMYVASTSFIIAAKAQKSTPLRPCCADFLAAPGQPGLLGALWGALAGQQVELVAS